MFEMYRYIFLARSQRCWNHAAFKTALIVLQVRLASVRRSLFTDEASRSRFLARLVSGSQEILQGQQGLAEHANYHEFCRLLGRLKTNYQLSELVRQAFDSLCASMDMMEASVYCTHAQPA